MLEWLTSHGVFLWLTFIFVGGGAVELLWYYVVVLRAADVRWDPQRCLTKNPSINLGKARRRKVSWPMLGLPLFLIAASLFVLQLWFYSWGTYILISMGWLLTAPLRKMWGMAVARRVYAQQHGERSETSYWHDVAYYYGWGFDLPSRPEGQVWFEDRLTWLNNFQKLWYVIQIWRFWGVFAQAVLSLLWPVVAIGSAFYHMDQTDDYTYSCPWWRFDRKTSRHQVVPGQVVRSEDHLAGTADALGGEPASSVVTPYQPNPS